MTSAELVVMFDVVDGLGQRPVSGLWQRQSQKAADDRQYTEDDERQLTSQSSTDVRLRQVVDERVEDAAETTGERTQPCSRIPTVCSSIGLLRVLKSDRLLQ